MSIVSVLNNKDFNEIRFIIKENGEVLFCNIDICRILEYSNNRAVKKLIEDEYGCNLELHPIETAGGRQETFFITEIHVLHLLLRSTKPIAKNFRKWLVNDFLPNIRKKNMLSLPDMKIIQPKLECYDAIMDTESVLSVEDFVKLYNKQLNLGRNKLFSLLREIKVLEKRNIPYQRYMKYFEVKVSTVNKDNKKILYKQVYIKLDKHYELFKLIKKHLKTKEKVKKITKK